MGWVGRRQRDAQRYRACRTVANENRLQTDKARAFFEKITGKKVPSKVSN